MDLALNYDETRVIPVPHESRTQTEAEQWARRAAAEYEQLVPLHPQSQERVQRALADLAMRTSDDQRLLLVVGVEGAVLAPLMIAINPEELSRREQAEFLWSNTAILPPTPRITESEGFGPGFSSTLAQQEAGNDFATRRWLFFGEGLTLGAMLGPVPPYGLAFVEPFAEALLASSSASGFVPKQDRSHVESLLSAVTTFGDGWQL